MPPHQLIPTMDPPDESLSEAEHMLARRGCCCFFVPSSSATSAPSFWWQPLCTPSAPETWWRRAITKVREWSELVAGPRWKTFIRRFRRGGGGGKSSGRFQYDPSNYARNFDEGPDEDADGEYVSQYRGFSARYASRPASAKSSIDLGGRDAPPLFAGWSGEISQVAEKV